MKVTKQHLMSLIKEEVELMKEEQLLNEQYDQLLEKIDSMSYDELHEAVLGRLAGMLGKKAAGAAKAGAEKLGGAVKAGAEKVGGAVAGAAKAGAAAIGQKVQAAKTATTTALQGAAQSMEKTKQELLSMYDEAKRQELEAIMQKAKSDAAGAAVKIMKDLVATAQKQGLPNPDAVALAIIDSVFLGVQEQLGRSSSAGMKKTSGVTVGGAAASGVAEE